MKSVVCHGPRDLRIEERETPAIKRDEVAIAV